MSVRHHLEEQIANEDKGYAIKTVKHKSHHENDMVSIVDLHVVKSTISCNCYWIWLYINRSRRDLPRLKAWVDNTLEDLCYYSFYQIPSA